jgi:rhamnose transport system ATP-binding protein
MSLAENVAIASWPTLGRFGFVPDAAVERLANDKVRNLGIRLRSIHQPVLSLSGGNQQKVVLGRWLALRPRVLLLDEPTRGIDVGAKAEIYQLIRDLVSNGVAILLSTSELPELLALANRSIVLRDGAAVGELPTGVSQEQVMRLATGGAIATSGNGEEGMKLRAPRCRGPSCRAPMVASPTAGTASRGSLSLRSGSTLRARRGSYSRTATSLVSPHPRQPARR